MIVRDSVKATHTSEIEMLKNYPRGILQDEQPPLYIKLVHLTLNTVLKHENTLRKLDIELFRKRQNSKFCLRH